MRSLLSSTVVVKTGLREGKGKGWWLFSLTDFVLNELLFLTY